MSILRTPTTYTLADAVLIRVLSNVHVGVGYSGELVDLPIQRDEFGFPAIFSSSIKGALKTSLLYAFMNTLGSYRKAKYAVNALLGPDPEEGESFESSIAILDAYLLAIPTRSLRGIYAYVTSPTLLKRFLERIELCSKFIKVQGESSLNNFKKIQGTLEKLINEAKDVGVDEALCVGECSEVVIEQPEPFKGKVLLIEEFLLHIKTPSVGEMNEKNNLSGILNILGIDKPLLILHDDIAGDVINRSLIRITRIRLRRDTKTVERGGLWTEEYVPIKTVLHTVFLYKRPPLTDNFVKNVLREFSNKNVDKVNDETYLEALEMLSVLKKEHVEELKKLLQSSTIIEVHTTLVEGIRRRVWEAISNVLQGFIILGGKETIGKGIVELKLLTS